MTKGIVGIQNIFGIGGIGQPSMIDIDMYKKASEVAEAYKILATVMYNYSSAKLQLRRSDTGAVIREKSITAADYDSTTIAMDDEYVFLLSQRVHTLECFRISDLSLVWTHGVYNTPGSGNNNLISPFGVSVYGDYVYVADSFNYRIKKISRATGAFVAALTGVGSDSRRPQYVECDGIYVYSYYSYAYTNSEMNILRIPVDMSSYSEGPSKTIYGGGPSLTGIIVNSGTFYFMNVLSSQISKSSAWNNWGTPTSISLNPIGGGINGDILYTTDGIKIYLLNKSTLATISSFAVDSGYNFRNVAVSRT